MRRLILVFLLAPSAMVAQSRDSLLALVNMYDRAIQANADNMEARVALAKLFLDKYNSGEAKRTLAAALARKPDYVPALVLEAKRRDFDNERGADSVLSTALRIDSKYVRPTCSRHDSSLTSRISPAR